MLPCIMIYWNIEFLQLSFRNILLVIFAWGRNLFFINFLCEYLSHLFVFRYFLFFYFFDIFLYSGRRLLLINRLSKWLSHSLLCKSPLQLRPSHLGKRPWVFYKIFLSKNIFEAGVVIFLQNIFIPKQFCRGAMFLDLELRSKSHAMQLKLGNLSWAGEH